MRYSRRSVVSLTPAEPGWDIEVTRPGDSPVMCPVVGWAVVVVDSKPGTGGAEGIVETCVEPAFVYDGAVFTPIEFAHTIGELEYQLVEPEE